MQKANDNKRQTPYKEMKLLYSLLYFQQTSDENWKSCLKRILYH